MSRLGGNLAQYCKKELTYRIELAKTLLDLARDVANSVRK